MNFGKEQPKPFDLPVTQGVRVRFGKVWLDTSTAHINFTRKGGVDKGKVIISHKPFPLHKGDEQNHCKKNQSKTWHGQVVLKNINT